MLNLHVDGDPDERHLLDLWWARGYDPNSQGAGLVCMACGALVSRHNRYADDEPYWKLHDAWHEQQGF
jgi:hypothetical protein